MPCARNHGSACPLMLRTSVWRTLHQSEWVYSLTSLYNWFGNSMLSVTSVYSISMMWCWYRSKTRELFTTQHKTLFVQTFLPVKGRCLMTSAWHWEMWHKSWGNIGLVLSSLSIHARWNSLHEYMDLIIDVFSFSLISKRDLDPLTK